MKRFSSHIINAVVMLSGVVGALVTQDMGWMVGATVIGTTAFIVRRTATGNEKLATVPNGVTALRLVLILIAVSMLNSWSDMISLGILIVALILDGLDGYLARKLDQSTVLGADLDMETDAAFAALLAVYWYLDCATGWWILIPGLLRYAFVILLFLARLHLTPVPAMRGAKGIAVFFFIVLLLPFYFEPAHYVFPLVVGGSMIVFSFGREFYLRYMGNRKRLSRD